MAFLIFLITFQYPTSASINKEFGVFSKGEVQLSASVDRKICCPGMSHWFLKLSNGYDKTAQT